ncbi:MAG TPA: hypothetical protein VIM87_12910 [Chitinophaga sp.]|uniref:hypothetical protein n=1 Tax=Chitinophaga sp. TaxID=1869181 RepID=UPI002F932BD6
MKYILFILPLCLLACHAPVNTDNKQTVDTTAPAPPPVTQQTDAQFIQAMPDTAITYGDFNGDQIMDTAYGVLFKDNSDEEDGQNEYIVRFSSDSITPLYASYGGMRLINEGDLNKDGRDDLSLFQEPHHGCTYHMSTWTYTNNKWKEIAAPWLVLTACEPVSDEDLQKKIVVENDTVYYYEADVSDDTFRIQKKVMALY